MLRPLANPFPAGAASAKKSGDQVAMSERKRMQLQIIESPPASRPVVHAPPALIASTHTVDYVCGCCGTTLMHAEDNQVHNLVIKCAGCGFYNATED